MENINLTREEVQVVLNSFDNCLMTCQDGGVASGCPDCMKLQGVKAKLQLR